MYLTTPPTRFCTASQRRARCLMCCNSFARGLTTAFGAVSWIVVWLVYYHSDKALLLVVYLVAAYWPSIASFVFVGLLLLAVPSGAIVKSHRPYRSAWTVLVLVALIELIAKYL